MKVLLVPGNDLPAAFYARLGLELSTRGVSLRVEPRPPLPSWTENAERLADAIEPGDSLVGHSLGGLFALLAAARRPRGLRHLLLLEPPIAPHRGLAALAAGRYRREVVLGPRDRFENWSGTAYRIHHRESFPPDALELYLEHRRRGDRDVLARLFATMPELYPLPFADIHVPTLLLTAAESGWRMRALGAYLSLRLRAEQRIVPGCGHFMANEADAALASIITRFIRG